MAKEKKSFIAYADWLETFEECSDEEAGKLVKHLFRYVNDLNPEAPDRLTKMLFLAIKRALKSDLKKYEAIKEKRSEAGKASAEKRKQEATNPTSVESVKQTSTNPTVNDTVNGNVTVTVNDNEIKETPFDIFWKAYDYNVGLRQAQNEWHTITKEMPSEIPKILIHVPKYVLSKPDKQFRKKPENYLKDRAWNDEVVIDSTKPKPNNGRPTMASPIL